LAEYFGNVNSFIRERKTMRTISLAFTAALVVCIAGPAYAQNLPTDAQCHVLGATERRGRNIRKSKSRSIHQGLRGRKSYSYDAGHS
jgi:hypothetical protein